MTLLPEERETPLKILIGIVELAEAGEPIYEAISYIWGPAENPMKITVEYSENATLSVTQNLASALSYLRHENEPRVL